MTVGANLNAEQIITYSSAAITLLLLIFAVNWRYFRDWVVAFLFMSILAIVLTSIVVKAGLITYPFRLLPNSFDTSVLFDLWVFPTLCILYNQVARTGGVAAALFYAFLFSAGITALEAPMELYTKLIEYVNWKWYYTFFGLTGAFLASRIFIAFYRWGCSLYSQSFMYRR
ncbi:MAG: CBO0543 family protein [Bacillota bacterium]